MSAPLSEYAIRLLAALGRARAWLPERALTDARLAELASIPKREVIDAALELLGAGYVVLAEVGEPPGRWLLCAEGVRDLDGAARQALLRRALAYIDSLRKRGVMVLRRAKVARGALRKFELDTKRQRALFEEPSSGRHLQWT